MIEDLLETYKTSEERRAFRTIQGDTLVHLSIKNRRICFLEPLLVDGAVEIEARNDRGETALILAARIGLNKAILVLYRFGAQINALSNDHDSALLWAIYRNQHTTTVLLLILGADPSLRYIDNRDAFGWAIRMDNAISLKYLFDYYPASSLNNIDNFGWTWGTLCKNAEVGDVIEKYQQRNILFLYKYCAELAQKHQIFDRALVKEITSHYVTKFTYTVE